MAELISQPGPFGLSHIKNPWTRINNLCGLSVDRDKGDQIVPAEYSYLLLLVILSSPIGSKGSAESRCCCCLTLWRFAQQRAGD